MLTGVEWVIPLRLLRLLEHLAVLIIDCHWWLIFIGGSHWGPNGGGGGETRGEGSRAQKVSYIISALLFMVNVAFGTFHKQN